MSRTYCIAEMKFVDVSALSDAAIETNNNQDVGNVNLFQTETEQASYGTLEHNQFVLDESLEQLPDTPTDIAFWSKEKSGSDCTFASNPKITIAFNSQHSSAGLTFYFAQEYPAELKITWYASTGTKLQTKTFYPDSLIYICRQQMENYGRIEIEFVKTLFPYRYIKLQRILYGLYIAWKDDEIQTAKIQEEVDLTSGTLSINTADIAIIDTLNEFDIGNENGTWKSVQKTQEIVLSEYKDGEIIPVGTFFIDTHSFSENVASFGMIDSIGLMDKYTFYEGDIYVNTKAGKILEQVFSCAGIKKYSISDEVYNTVLTGYLPVQTCREALQMICFACGAVADDSRSDTVKVYKPDRYVKFLIGTDRKFSGGSKVTLDDYVSGVSIECSNYVLDSESSEIYNDILLAGDTKITFSEPYKADTVTVSAGSIKEVKTNYVIVSMDEEGICTITGRKYTAIAFTYQKNLPEIAAGEFENIKKFTGCTLYNPNLLPYNAQYLLNYYGLRKKLDMRYLLEREQVGNWANIRDTKGQTATTVIESQTIDLAGGYIATASCRGYSIVITENFYTGTELYAGGSVLL